MADTEALDIIKWLVIQHLSQYPGGEYDSGFLSADADALRYLGKHGVFKISIDDGKYVFGRFTEANR